MTDADESTVLAGKRWSDVPPAGQWAIAAFVFFDLALWLLALSAPSGPHTGALLLDVAFAALVVALAGFVVTRLTPSPR